jgi:hypothetical protein
VDEVDDGRAGGKKKAVTQIYIQHHESAINHRSHLDNQNDIDKQGVYYFFCSLAFSAKR